MKKKLLLVFLALAIMTSLSAGTLAVYTRTVTDAEQIVAKRFAFSASGSIAGDNQAIVLAPTESMQYDFTMANFDTVGGPVAEVPLTYNVSIDFRSAAAAMPGLKATLYEGTTKLAESTNGIIVYNTQSAANATFNHTYKVTLTWADDGSSNTGHTTAGTNKVTFANGLTLKVVATQTI